jgi:hypothetical protein
MARPFVSKVYHVSPTFRLRITMEQIGQNHKKNTSTVQVVGVLHNDSNFHIWNERADVWRSIEGEAEHKPPNFKFNLAPHDSDSFIHHAFVVKHNGTTGLKSVDFTVNYGDTGTAESDGPAHVGAHLVLDRIPQEPSAPTNVHFTDIKQTSVTVRWSPPDETHGAPIKTYRVRRWNNAHTKSHVSDSGGLSRHITGLDPGATYYFEVRAENRIGPGPYSGEELVDLSGGGAVRAGDRWNSAEAFIRRPGTHKWVEATPYVRVGGVWKLAR